MEQKEDYGFVREALILKPQVTMQLSPDTVRRYYNGKVGRTLKWLLDNPEFMIMLGEMSLQNRARRKGETVEDSQERSTQ